MALGDVDGKSVYCEETCVIHQIGTIRGPTGYM